MPPRIKTAQPVQHDARLTLVEHLDELRSRLIFCVAALTVIFAVCVWQNDALLKILNQPLADTTQASIKNGDGIPGQIDKNRKALLGLANSTLAVTAVLRQPGSGLSPKARAALAPAIKQVQEAKAQIPKQTEGAKPVTLRVGEPFTTTLTVSLYFALLFALPLLLYQLYAFILPAFTPRERKVALPMMLMVPFLFIAGVLFGYFVVLPPAVQFLQNFNSEQFNILVQASDYYKFAVLALIGLGLLFQMPVAILAAVKAGIVTVPQLRKNRRYAFLIIAVVAMLLPGTDPVTMLISMVPLLFLYEGSIILAAVFARNDGNGDDDGDDDPPDDELQDGDDAVLVHAGAGWESGHGDDDEDEWDDPAPRRDSGGGSSVS